MPLRPIAPQPPSVAISACFSLFFSIASPAFLSGCASQEVVFCRETNCAERVIGEVDLATTSVHSAIYSFTNSDIADSLVLAASRPGVEVQVLTEASQSGSDSAQAVLRTLTQAGIDVRLAFKADCACGGIGQGIMHHKFTVVDRETVLSGSYNYSCSATYCSDENVVITRNAQLAEDFEAEFRYLFENGEPAL